MVTQPVSRRPAPINPPSFFSKALAALVGGAIFFALLLAIFSIGFSLVYLGRIYPGVSVGGVDLSGVRRSEAAAVLREAISYPQHGQVTLNYGEQSWTYTPAELGLQLDAEASAEAAYAHGRSLWPWVRLAEQVQVLTTNTELAPRLVFDGQAASAKLNEIAQQINQPTIEAELSIQGLNVQVSPGQVGHTLDVEASTELIATQVLRMENAEQDLVVHEQAPRILDVSAQAAIANEILSKPLRIVPGGSYADNPEGWTFQSEELGQMLTIERVDHEDGASYQVGLDNRALGAFLAGLAPEVVEEAENARFIFNDETRQLELIESEIIGRRLEVDLSLEHINQQLAEGAHQIELQYDYSLPEIRNDATAADLGITELIHSETSYFYGSSSERIQNIQTAAARFHGLLVPPGATFSMVDNIGDISLDSGFAEALIIYGDRTIKGVGGGVCQVSTTLFRTVFFSGYPVIERNPHAYRVYYYELNAAGGINPDLVGLDATVYAPVVDFKFQNDTPYWLLMETYVDPGARTLTWKFYSTSDGRTVEWDTTGVKNKVEAPEPVYEENDELEKGEVKQVDWEAEGADVTVTRTVSRDGSIIIEDIFKTHYLPWAAVYQYGPGTPGYPPKHKDPVDN
jgi:vancomycin resistance protein YoaR